MHHNDAPNLDPRTDITDLYAFQKPGDPTRSIFIVNVHPDAPVQGAAFDPEASYELKIDTDGDAEADLAFHVRFAPAGDGRQTATVYRADGADARETGPAGEEIISGAPVCFDQEVRVATAGGYRFYAGLRSDPFFIDPVGFRNNFQWTGRDARADKNVFGIALEVPNSALGPNPRLGVWARTLAPVHGALAPVNQMGRPGNNVYKRGAEDFNATPPARQRARYLPQFVATFQSFGYSEDEATALALEWLPDILSYDYTSAAGFPNGRQLADDVADELVRVITGGRMSDDLLGPHTDFLADFPYLGPPHPVAMA